jgi:hypothetical protein
MFGIESGFTDSVRLYGRPVAVEVCLDIHEYTELHGPKESVGEPKLNGRQLFDFNEHFIELGSPNGNRSTDFMVFGVLIVTVAFFCYVFGFLVFQKIFSTPDDAPPIWIILFIGIGTALFIAIVLRFNWYSSSRFMFFTALVARFRFNRTTGKVYVLRPKKFGGNAVLDWNRVKAHIAWRPSLMLEPGFQHDPAKRQLRRGNGEGALLLYWPPLDPSDPERRGEDFIRVDKASGGAKLWEYIRRFMEEGIDAVPPPESYEYLRKGRYSMSEQMWEIDLEPLVRQARSKGETDPEGFVEANSNGIILASLPFLPLNSMAQWLCYWPTFPVEWNSDCGQRRREKGIGPEEPLRWKVKPAT